MDQKDSHKLAIEAIEACQRHYKVSFMIQLIRPANGYVSRYSGKWKISVMSKTFYNKDFILACKEALTFVYNAHNPEDVVV